jgi:hypothetical protein
MELAGFFFGCLGLAGFFFGCLGLGEFAGIAPASSAAGATAR